MITLSDAVKEFLLDQQVRGNSAKTLTWYTGALKVMQRYLPSELQQVEAHDIRQYIVLLRQRLSESSVFSYATALFGFWAWAAGEYGIANPCANIKRPRRPKPEPKATTAEDIVKLLRATRDDVYGVRDRAIIAFLMDTGARLGGAAGLVTTNLFIEDGTAIVTEKGNKKRRVHFTPFTARLLYAWMWERARLMTIGQLADHVFVNIETGQRLTPSGIEQVFKRLKKRAGVTGRVNPHSFRHHFAREYVRNGGDIATLAKLLGHASIEMTSDYYAIFSDDELKEFHAKHTPANGLFE